jgi:hypothetical protein
MSALGVPNSDIKSAISLTVSNPEIVKVIDKQVNNFVQAQKKEFKLKPAILSGIKTLVGVSIMAATAYAFHNKAFGPTALQEVYKSTALAILPKVLTAISSKDPNIKTSTAVAVIPSGFVLVKKPTFPVLFRAFLGGMSTLVCTIEELAGEPRKTRNPFCRWNDQYWTVGNV